MMTDDMDIVFAWMAEQLREEWDMTSKWDTSTLAAFFEHAADRWGWKWRATVIPAYDGESPAIFEFRGPSDLETAQKLAERRAGLAWDRIELDRI